MARGIAWTVFGVLLVGCHLVFPHGSNGNSSTDDVRGIAPDRSDHSDQASLKLDQAKPTPDQAKPTPDQAKPTPDQAKPTLDQAAPNPDQAKPKLDQAQAKDSPKPKSEKKFYSTDKYAVVPEDACAPCVAPSTSCGCACECFPMNTYCPDIQCTQ